MIIKSYYTKLVLFLSAASIIAYFILSFFLFYTIRTRLSHVLIESQNQRIAYFFSKLDSLSIEEELEQNYFEYEFSVFDKDKKLLYSTDSQNKLQSLDLNPTVFDIYNTYENQNKSSIYRYFLSQLNPVKKPIFYETFYYHGIALFLIILISAAIGFIIVKRLNYRLFILMDGINRLKKGELHHQIRLRGNDELANVANAYNEMAKTLSDTIVQLKDSNEAQKRFLAHASHEIKTPLTSLKGIVDIISFMKIIPKDRKELLDIANENVKQINRLNEQVLNLAQLKTSEYEIEKRRFDIIPIIKQELIAIEIQAEKQNLTIDSKIEIESCFIESDFEHLSQIFTNLVQNAFKYAMRESIIELSVKKINETLSIKITNLSRIDYGEKPQHLFETFYRHPKVSQIKGSGLGLSLAKELCDKLGIKIDYSYQNKRFCIELVLGIV